MEKIGNILEKKGDPLARYTKRYAAEDGGKRDEYMKLFKDTLEKFKVNSPSELDEGEKIKFFKEIDKNWTSKEEKKD